MASECSRRDVLKTMSLFALGTPGLGISQNWKWSSGSEFPKTKMPPDAADCHFHVYNSRFPPDPKAMLRPHDATVEDYLAFQKRIGTSRGVIVQPSTYGIDNRLTLESLGRLGAGFRGIAVVNSSIADAELQTMNQAGVRGIRFNLVQGGGTTMDMLEPLSKRIADLGWHIQINARADLIAEAAETWRRVACPLVFDHLGHVTSPSHAAFGVLVNLLQKSNAWVKISGFYMDTKIGAPTYTDSGAVVKAFVKEASQRMVWGSDWPHPTERESKPDDAVLLDAFAEWVPDQTMRNRILVANPSALYGFQ